MPAGSPIAMRFGSTRISLGEWEWTMSRSLLLGGRLLQLCAVPVSEVGGGLIRTMAKFEERIPWRSRGARIVEHQQKFAQLFIVGRCCWAHWSLSKSIRRRHGVRIECRFFDCAAARPKTYATDFVRVRFPGHRVRSGAFWRAASGKPRDGEIKTPPKEMDWADFAEKARAKFLEDGVHGHEDSPECVCVLWIVSAMHTVLVEANRIRNLHGHVPNLDVDFE